MSKARLEFNDKSASYECVTEGGRYREVHFSKGVGIFQNSSGDCVFYADGEVREVAEGEEHSIDDMTYIATLNGWEDNCQHEKKTTELDFRIRESE